MDKYKQACSFITLALLALCAGCGYLGGVDTSIETTPALDFSNYKKIVIETDSEDEHANIDVATFLSLKNKFEIKFSFDPKDVEKVQEGDLYIKVETKYGLCLPPLFGIMPGGIPIFDFFPADKVSMNFLDGGTKKEVVKYVYRRGVFSFSGYPEDVRKQIFNDLHTIDKGAEDRDNGMAIPQAGGASAQKQ